MNKIEIIKQVNELSKKLLIINKNKRYSEIDLKESIRITQQLRNFDEELIRMNNMQLAKRSGANGI